jgi:microcystin-dependent protein
MADPYIGEIRLFGGNFAPNGWASCDGQLLQISEYDTLFNLIGTTYGGDGQETFALPNLNGRVPVHFGTGPGGVTRQIAEVGGSATVTITQQTTPIHTHPIVATTAGGTQNAPAGNVLAQSPTVKPYLEDATTVALSPSAVTLTGGSQPHDNMQPYLAVTYIISLFGIYPSPT